MVDIAQIGIKLDTVDVTKGTAELNKFRAAAAGVGSTVGAIEKAVTGSSAQMLRALTLQADANAKTARETLARLKATREASAADIAAAKHAIAVADADLKAARAAEARAKSERTLIGASNRPGNVVSNIASGGRVGAAPIARDQLPNRFNTANVAAQFQDIAVTASAGFNPAVIALQQGTQLSAIINSMENPLKGIALAFRSVFNAVSLLSIGLVALVAAGIQMIDWAATGQAVLNGLADIIEATAEPVIILTGALTLLYAPAIITGIKALTVSILATGRAALVAGAQMASGWVLGLGPIGLIAAGIAAVIGVVALFREEFKNLIGVDVLESIKTAINKVIGFFIGLIDNVKNGILGLIALTDEQDASEFFNKIGSPIEAARRNETDYIGGIAEGAQNAAGYLRDMAKGLGEVAEAGKETKIDITPDPFDKFDRDVTARIKGLRAQEEAVGMNAIAAAELRYETELLSEAQRRGITFEGELGKERRLQLQLWAVAMADAEARTARLSAAYQFVQQSSSNFIQTLRNDLEQGKSIWESFGAAVKRVIDGILDQLINNQLQGALQGLIPGGAKSSGFLGGVADLLFSAGGSQGAIARFDQLGSFGAQGPLQPFAKGGVFTNSMVDRPTPFAFAGGGAFGLMGEAGPEAVMPLERGPDGSLGVRVTSSAANDNSEGGNIYNIDARGADQGAVLRIEQSLMALAGPGVIERRVSNAQTRGAL